MPFALAGVEFRSSDDAFEGSVLLQVQHLVAVVEVGLQLGPVGVVGGPSPVLDIPR